MRFDSQFAKPALTAQNNPSGENRIGQVRELLDFLTRIFVEA